MPTSLLNQLELSKKIKIDSNQYHLHNARPCVV